MLQDDYILRQIREMVRAVLKMLFQVDTQELTPEIIENESERAELERLILNFLLHFGFHLVRNLGEVSTYLFFSHKCSRILFPHQIQAQMLSLLQ